MPDWAVLSILAFALVVFLFPQVITWWFGRKNRRWLAEHPEAMLTYRQRLERGDPLKERPSYYELWEEHRYLVDNGLLEPGETTRWAEVQRARRNAEEFTPRERAAIRAALGMEREVTWAELARYDAPEWT